MKVLLFVVVLSAVSVVGCGSKDKIAAIVNGETISAAQFAERYQKYLQSGAQRDNIVLRQKILNNMINERLIYADCARQGFDSDEAYRRKMERVESQALVDAYTKSIAVDTVKATEAELQQEFRKYNSKVRARYLYAETEEGALRLREALDRGATFDQLARDVFEDPGLANNGGDVGFFGWNEMEPAFEDAAYSMPIGQISEPIRMKVGFGIIQVLDRVVVNPLASEMDFATVKVKLERVVLQHKSMRLAREAAYGIVDELQPRFNEPVLRQVLDYWKFVSPEKLETEKRTTVDRSLTSQILVEFWRSKWTVGEFLKRSGNTLERQRKRVKTTDDLKDFVKGLALREELLSRARKANFSSNSDVRTDIELARQNFLLKRWMSSVRDTVGSQGWPENAMRDVYSKFTKEFAYPPEVNVAEILVRTKEEATKLHEQLRRGADFSALAQKHSLRRSTAKNNGEIGWGTRASFGNMSEKFFSAKKGEVLGPEFVDPYWGVFKILGKNEMRPKSFDEARTQIAERLASGKRLESIEQAVSTLRSRASISIDNDVVSNIVINLNQDM